MIKKNYFLISQYCTLALTSLEALLLFMFSGRMRDVIPFGVPFPAPDRILDTYRVLSGLPILDVDGILDGDGVLAGVPFLNWDRVRMRKTDGSVDAVPMWSTVLMRNMGGALKAVLIWYGGGILSVVLIWYIDRKLSVLLVSRAVPVCDMHRKLNMADIVRRVD